MATGAVLPADRVIYRAIPFENRINRDGTIKYQSFLLRPAHDEWPDEDYLSFGTTPEGAKEGLTTVYTVAEISVADIIAPPHSLEVREDVDNPNKARVYGVPLKSENEELAVTIAKDLGRKSRAHPP